ncbi:hypothetical protein ACFQ0B_54600 [Nonomuraea thailandensis]
MRAPVAVAAYQAVSSRTGPMARSASVTAGWRPAERGGSGATSPSTPAPHGWWPRS